MNILNPQGFWFLLTIPIIIFFYILKQNFEDTNVSSLYLWNLTITDSEVSSPWQKFRKNILLLLQIIITLLIVFALCRPYIVKNVNKDATQIIVIDTSGSMSAYDNNDETRLDKALKSAERKIKNLSPNSSFSLITVSNKADVLINNSKDTQLGIKIIRSITPTNASSNLLDHMDFINSLATQTNNYELTIYSDSYNDYFKPLQNVSLDYINLKKDNDLAQVSVKITNRSFTAESIEIGIYDKSSLLLDMKRVDIDPNKSSTVFFEDISFNGDWLYAELLKKDSLLEDNKIYNINLEKSKNKILLVTDSNVFLEKAINSLKNYELYKTNDISSITDEYDLYIFDKMVPKALPTKGNFLFINPEDSTEFFSLGEYINGGYINVNESPLSTHMLDMNFIISKFKPIVPSTYSNVLFNIGANTVGSYGNYNGRKFILLSFDIHESDFPLNVGFPIFINNSLDYLIESSYVTDKKLFTGDTLSINPLSETKNITVVNPNGNSYKLNINYPLTYFDKTNQPGIYEVILQTKDSTQKQYVAFNFPTQTESNLDNSNNKDIKIDTNISEQTTKSKDYVLNLSSILIVFAIIMLLYEWKKYIKA